MLVPPPPPGHGSFITIAPGQRVSRQVRLLHDFSEPGTYRVSISTEKKRTARSGDIYRYYDGDVEKAKQNPDNVWTGTLTSNTVTINIVPKPTGKVDGTGRDGAADGVQVWRIEHLRNRRL